MASSQQHDSLTARSNRGQSSSADGINPQVERVQERLGEWVAQRPWTMVGAAAGVGVALGAATRLRPVNELTRVVAATASGVAVRLAINSLTHWFERERP
jgi:surfactin synthase thioesterase subunit